MSILLNSRFSCNSVIWISSLPNAEMSPTNRMVETMAAHSRELGFLFQHFSVSRIAKLWDLLDEISIHARDYSLKPIVHFDTHGHKDAGIYVDGEGAYADWNTLAEKLRAININTKNNLAVVGATCFGLQAIKPISIQTEVPFFLLLAPEDDVTVGFLEDNVPNFYRTLFELGDIDEAQFRHLSKKFKYFHCEKMLFIVIARYLKEQCKGKGGAERRERLITEIFSQGMEKTPDNLKLIRKKLKEGLRPDQGLLDRFTGIFLIGRPCSFSMEDLENFIESSSLLS
ncbi:hypothetical protein [Undibacterium sp. TS12]|uniref:hypothetical protein n=1 Tax=Undibacterium sp. TS12 TaxID=2908202 RepID=UPI001F4CA22C|nr:hypothetical protein [Undibacterium sp. TS12]MCH8618019.1 hypothetical protein [Undibacterium sp. TS12]